MTTTTPDGGGQAVPPNIEGMTLKIHAAIQLQMPHTGIDWLDEMITQARAASVAERMLLELYRKHECDATATFHAWKDDGLRPGQLSADDLAAEWADQSNVLDNHYPEADQ